MSNFSTRVAALDEVCLRTFGSVVEYTPAGEATVDIDGILEETAQPEDAEDGTYVLLFARRDEFDISPVKGDTLKSNTRTYTVVRIEDDREGGLRLLARRNA